MIVLGIVGSIAGGKSTVARQLQDLGAVWINADSIAKESLDLIEVKSELVRHFGDHLLDFDGQIDRQKLGAIVFGEDQASQMELRYLESLVHPVVRKQISQILKKNTLNGILVSLLDVPLLFESGWDRSCDEIWCVDAKRELRAERAAKRGWQPDELTKREGRQLSIQNKIQLSNYVLENNGTLDQLHHTSGQHWQRMMAMQTKPIVDSHCQ